MLAFPPGAVLAQSAGTILPKGTVPVLRGVVSGSVVVNQPKATATGNILTIDQMDPQVVIDWSQFNIASGSIVRFVQPSSTASALNRIYSSDPSIIQGQLTATGQIFLINQNGILFDRGSQVNVNTLYASTLNISNSQYAAGVVPATSQTPTPTFVGAYDNAGNTIAGSTGPGSIQVGVYGPAGAAAPSLTSAAGGAIVLIAPIVNNKSGIITSPDGQVILAAGNKAYLQFPDATDTTLRGLVVEIDADSGPVNVTSMVSNMGSISATRGNVTLAGLAVNQGGAITATTALQENGSIFLQANTLDNARMGTVTLQQGSVIATPLDQSDTSKLPASQAYDPYRAQVTIDGSTIIDDGIIRAPAGIVSITASDPQNLVDPRIYLGSSSVVDVSGDVATAPFSQNLLTFKVTSNELNNSPDQKGKILEGATVTVDLNAGSTVLDLAAYQANLSQTLDEKATSAGSVTLSSTGDIVQRLGSVINANGGSTQYSGGKDPVTQLLGADGKIYSITSAPETQTYTALLGTFSVDHPHWGQVDTYTNLLMGLAPTEAAYSIGGTGGSVTILPGDGLVLDGAITASTTAGATQTQNAPRGGSLTIGQVTSTPGVPDDFGVNNIVFANGAADTLGASFTATTPLTPAQLNSVRISSDLFPGSGAGANGTYQQNGFDNVVIGANETITVPAGVSLGGGLGGSLTLLGQSLVMDGHITIPAGSVTLEGVKTTAPLATGGSYQITVDGTVSTAGLWSNDFPVGSSPLPSSVVSATVATGASTSNGGSITIAAPNEVIAPSNVTIGPSAVLDASAGGSLSSAGKIAGGNGGSISISAQNSTSGTAATLNLDGTLRGYGFASGGSLAIAVDDATLDSSGSNTGGHFNSAFFDSGGFASYTIAGTFGVAVAADTVVHPVQQNYVLSQMAAAALPSAGNVAAVADVETLPAYTRKPSKLTLSSSLGTTNVGAGAVLEVDPQGSVSVAGALGVDFEGRIAAPGGTVSLAVVSPSIEPPELEIGPSASIDVAGTFIPGAPSAIGLRQGTVVGGGTVSLTTTNSNLAASAGSLIDVSGTAAAVDQLQLLAQPIQPTTVAANAGVVNITINDQYQFASTLVGHAPAGAAGGTFVLTDTNRNDLIDNTTGRRIVLSDNVATPAATTQFTDAAVALAPLRQAGFDKISLTAEDEIEFAGPTVNAAFARGVTLDSQQFDVADGTRASVSGAAVVLSNTFGQRVENSSLTGTILDNTLPSLPIATQAGTGTLAVAGNSLDLQGSLTINGASQTNLVSQNDIRLTGRVLGSPLDPDGGSIVGGLTTVGNLVLQGTQIYPTTRTTFTIAVADGLSGVDVPGGAVSFKGNGTSPAPALSAGGDLTVLADTINQGGVVKAPLGTLDFDGATALNLLPGSTTSTSALGEIIPYGGTSAGVSWLYASTNGQPYNALTAPPVKSMTLTGKNVDIESGAKVDLSGGGDILGIEFVPGSGGDTDILAQPNTYAILPAAQFASMPVDTAIATVQNLGFGNPSSVYNEIHIATGGVVPAGNYVLLPGYYALLPGADIVQVQSKSYSSLLPGQSVSMANGLNVVPAQLAVAGTSIESSQTIGVVVQPGANATKLADYNEFGSSFFTKVASEHGATLPVVPDDAGQLTLAAAQNLAINGTLVTTPGTATANAAEIDITGQYIAVVNQTGRTDIPANYLQVSAAGLSSIDGSVLIGGDRTETGNSVTVTPTANSIIIANNASTPLHAPELLLAATDSIELDPGSVVTGAGGQAVTPLSITINPAAGAAGAFIRASNSTQVSVTRSIAPDPNAGTITIDAGATLGASGSLLVDATSSTSFAGHFALDPSAALSLSSSVINLGDTAGTLPGLTLDQAQLTSLNNLSALVLKSYSTIDVFGAGVSLGGSGLQNLTLDGEALVGQTGAAGDAASLSATAGTVNFTNSSGTQYAGAQGAGGGVLALNGNQVVLGAGSKAIVGFSSAVLNGSQVEGQDSGTLDVAAPLTISASSVAAQAGANQTWLAADLAPAGQAPANYYQVTFEPHAGQAPAATGLGGVLAIQGSDIVSQGTGAGSQITIAANAGNITLAALGGGAGPGIEIGSGTVIDASGRSSNFVGTLATADAGTVSLTTDHGAVALAAGSTINVSGAVAGGSAGAINISGPSVALGGALLGSANSGQQQGSFTLQTSNLPAISTLAPLLSAGGFTESVNLRATSGSIALGSGDVLTAHQVTLSADAGAIALGAGSAIEAASSVGSSSVSLNAQNDITLAAGSLIDASASPNPAGSLAVNGGSVALSTRAGTISMASGAVIDVSAGPSGTPGTVSFTAPRGGATGVAVQLDGSVLSASHGNTGLAEVDVYGNAIYPVGNVLTSAEVAQIVADNQTFMASVDAAGLASTLKGDGGVSAQGQVHVRPAVEVQSQGDLMIDPTDTGSLDLTVAGQWRLTNSNSTALESGTLTIRAAGTLTVSNEAIGLPDDNLYPGYTWNINLVSGADLGAANVLQNLPASTLGTSGDVVLDGAYARVTSGSGNINIAAGHDFLIDSPQGVVYTSGVPVANVSDAPYNRWATGGGNITITAQHDAIGSADEWIDDWYRRTASGVAGDLGAWWAYRQNFHDGVGALGGGNITIAAGDDVNNLSAFIPTSGRVYSPNPLTVKNGKKTVLGPGPFYLDVEGGGNLSVTAGNDLIGGQYLVALGTGQIKAGGTVGAAGSPTQLFLMGENEVTSRQQATINVQAGGSVNLQSINDPTVIAQPKSTGEDPSISVNGYQAVNFLTYSPDSALSVKALGGDVTVVGQPQAEPPLNPSDAGSGGLFADGSLNVDWPANVSLVAFTGSISSQRGTFSTYPSPSGGIQLLAGQSITSIDIAQTDNGPPGSGVNGISNWANPASQFALTAPGITGGITQFTTSAPFVDDVVALDGSVTDSTFLFPARSRVWAGTNVDNVQLTLQNVDPSDLSEIVANTGFFNPALAQITIGGPGQLLIQAGGTLDLGAGPGGGVPELVATGNLLDASIASSISARLTLVAGVSGPINLGNLDSSYAELITAGLSKDTALAKAAAASIFGTAKVNGGDIDTYLTSVQTDQGSGIDLLAPGGNITVGLTTPPSSNTTIGIVTNAGGAISSYLSGDFDINQGKVLTAQGGNILIYTTDGSIDAGRGAKTSLTTSPPQRIPLYSGGVLSGYQYIVSTAAAGSGIQTLTSNVGETQKAPPAGNIYLFAPAGTVDAGEAGIVSGAGVFIEAERVLNASNISSAGPSVGVPVTQSGSLASSITASGTASTSGTDAAAANAARAAAESAANAGADAFRPAVLTVEVLGFGEQQCKETDKQCLKEAQ